MEILENSGYRGWSHGDRLWLLLVLLAVIVILPAAGLLWFMGRAVHNERLAMREKLAVFYRQQLSAMAVALNRDWEDRARALADSHGPPAGVFLRWVTNGLADSAVIYDTRGVPLYPVLRAPARSGGEGPPESWRQAENLEFALSRAADAAESYSRLAERTGDAGLAARALKSAARNYFKAGMTAEALRALGQLDAGPYRDARDEHGRLVRADALLLAVQRLPASNRETRPAVAEELAALLADQTAPPMPPAQRIFLMRELKAGGFRLDFSTLAAEQLALDYLQRSPAAPKTGGLSKTGGIWRLPSADRRVVALYEEPRLIQRLAGQLALMPPLPGVSVTVAPASEKPAQEPWISAPIGGLLADWELRADADGTDALTVAARRQIQLYVWTALLVIAALVLTAFLAGRHLLRQVRLTRLKNDFVSTVSHELKTPLASTRLLVDTLLDGTVRDPRQARDYLDLIRRENERLGRLIDNFLSFARMEHNRRTMALSAQSPADIARAAAAVVTERFQGAGCEFTCDIEPALPDVRADHDAMVTVLTNLLDNAFKYTGDQKKIALRARRAGAGVVFEVEDNGVGIARRDLRRVFQRFYQVDRALSRKTGGCGLGLSFVKFIVDAHRGRIDIDSRPGRGSVFAVSLPAPASAHEG